MWLHIVAVVRVAKTDCKHGIHSLMSGNIFSSGLFEIDGAMRYDTLNTIVSTMTPVCFDAAAVGRGGIGDGEGGGDGGDGGYAESVVVVGGVDETESVDRTGKVENVEYSNAPTAFAIDNVVPNVVNSRQATTAHNKTRDGPPIGRCECVGDEWCFQKPCEVYASSLYKSWCFTASCNVCLCS